MKSLVGKYSIFYLFIILFLNNTVYSYDDNSKPIINKEYTIHYDLKSNIFNKPKNLTLIYTFDYWSAPFSRDVTDSILIIKCMTSDRKKSAQMIKNGDSWEAHIVIPSNARILSYIITDGEKYDLNNQQTYAQYIYNDKIMPVRESCQYMMLLYEFTKQNYDEQITEIKKELELYPANFSAYYYYWKIILYKEMYNKETVSRVLNEILALYKQYSNNPEVCEVIVRIYRGGVLSDQKLFKTISAIPLNLLTEESKSYVLEELERIESEERENTMSNSLAPDFNVTDLNKNNITLSGFRGKVVLLYFFCPYPKKKGWINDLDSLQKLSDKFKNENFNILCFYSTQVMQQAGIIKNLGKTKSDSTIQDNEVMAFIKKKGYVYPFIKYDDSIAEKYKTHFLNYFLIDKKGGVYNIGRAFFMIFLKDVRNNISKLLLE